MPPIIPKAFDATVSKSGFTIALCEAKSGQFIRIGVTQAAQAKYFGGVLDHAVDALALELSNDLRKNHILKVTLANIENPNAQALNGGIKFSLHMKLMPWSQVAAGKRPATELVVLGATAGKEVLLKLPEWARPEALKIGQGKPLMEC